MFAVAPEVAILASQKPTVILSEGASGALMCTATGVPAPTISWFRDGVILNDDCVAFVLTSSTDASTSLLSVTSTLNVTSVMRENAFATITCTASNGVGANSSDTTQLIVLCKSLSASLCLMWFVFHSVFSRYYLLCHLVPPTVTAISANQTVTSPAPVSFNCTVDSYPPSTITWLHNGAEVQAAPPRVTISTVQVDNRTQESTLTLLNTTAEDIGAYTCSAAPVTVNENVTIDTVVSPLENTTLGLGRVTSYLRLSVTRPSDAGVYECVSSNLLGSDTDRTNLTVHCECVHMSTGALAVPQVKSDYGVK